MGEVDDRNALAARLAAAFGSDPERTAEGLVLIEEHLLVRVASRDDVRELGHQIEALRGEIGREADGLLAAICREMGTSQSVTEKELMPLFRRHAHAVSDAMTRHTAAVGAMLLMTLLIIALLIRFG